MKGNILLLLQISLLVLSIYSCEESEDPHWISKVRIENYSEIDLDSVMFYTSTNYFRSNPSQIIFDELKSGAISDCESFENLEITISIRVYINNDSITKRWFYPDYRIDPSGPALIPSGIFHFGIVDCDTVDNIMDIGLVEYFRN